MNENIIGFKERLAELFEIEKDKDPALTQEEFAAKCGATRNQLKGWLSGQGSPNPNKMREIAKTYNVSTSWLVGETNVREQFSPKPEKPINPDIEIIALDILPTAKAGGF